MADPRFFDRGGPLALAEAASLIGARLLRGAPETLIADVAPLGAARDATAVFAVSKKALKDLAGEPAVLIGPESLLAETGIAFLAHPNPQAAFARLAAHLYPAAGHHWGPASGPAVDPSARLAIETWIEPGAVIGPGAEIGQGTRIAAGAVIGRGVAIGRDCFVGPGASIGYALLGDHVAIGAGCRIGGDGFGYVFDGGRHVKVPQLGRVIVQDHVEMGSGCTIDRGALDDTVIGEGTKLDNMVHVAHNVRVGRHCLLIAQAGIAGSAVLGDYVVLAGQVGVTPHVRIGDGARVVGQAGVNRDLAGGKDYAGTPVRPAMQWRRENAILARLAKRKTADE
jgi:UDP-3-O-[3-hydroxymyristoyl] glucosamine N-acyltransferase